MCSNIYNTVHHHDNIAIGKQYSKKQSNMVSSDHRKISRPILFHHNRVYFE